MKRHHKILAAVAAVAVAGAGGYATTRHHSSNGWTPPVTEPAGDLGVACGKERWTLKTGTDPGATAVNLTPAPTTIATLAAVPAPVNLSPAVRETAEQHTYTIHATITAYKEEADKDFHLALSDGSGHTMIAEIPAPSCVGAGSPFGSAIQATRDVWNRAHPPSASFVTVNQQATITGVFFFDKLHGQRGVAPNGAELHPVTALVLG